MLKEENTSRVPEFPKSYWRDVKDLPSFPPLQKNESTDIAVVGGGIAGIISAYLLAKAGRQVTLIDAGKLMDGVTGNTTAKITAQHGLFYFPLIKIMGEEKARLYYEANIEGLNWIKQTAAELNIDCDFAHQNAFVYSQSKISAKLIEKEAEAYQQLGIDGGLAKDEVELPYEVEQAIVMRNQAQFHPVKFLTGLVHEIERLGGTIYEKTRAVKILKKDDPVIQTENMSHLSCNKVIVATHYPFNDSDGLYFSRLNINRSYVIGVRTNGPIPNDMYISADTPSRSLRYATTDDGEKLLLIGGDGHPTGKSKTEIMQHYRNLEQFGDQHFGIEDIPYRWSAQDMTTLDKVPYIGTVTAGYENILVATGFHKWGMAHGAVSGLLLSDQILGNDNRYASLYDPTRPKLKAVDIASFLKDNGGVAKELVKGKLKMPYKTVESLGKDEGALVKVGNKKAGGYRDKYGQVHLVDTTCTHMGCETTWNNAERSWDCPCHGSRFSYTGEVMEGPAVKPLNKLGDQ
ncbi:FAD-dependent oxidoreductase [Planococcus sp. N028]|uniref:FAD-dependent oxidoreductase n=1 Tax=Planococcus shixiaomingii TaxID=3058393 RepID=A0ABT8N6H1_9BACL|nr:MULTISPECIES: FAD-dependent oxidoreductase [unclassified Planococcus (in: firmicutes)]MDN7243334.1 FAD-dependent oxidoreductase [Planococcus sp. N028]WKA55276.1 FAD-dependent oxidoreductase [Planococcus sp. N022]